MKRIFTSLGLSGSFLIASVIGLTSQQIAFGATTQHTAVKKPAKSSAKSTPKTSAKAPSKAKVASKKVTTSKDAIPEVQTTTSAGFDVDPRVLAASYGKQANAYYALAQKKEKAGRLDDAQKLYFKSLAVRQKVWGDTDPATPAIIYKIGDIHMKKGRLDAAEACYKRELTLVSKQVGPGSYELVPSLNRLGEIAFKQKRYQDAYDNYNRVVQLQEKKSGSEADPTVAARLNAIDASVGLKDWSEAEKQLKLADQALTGKNDTHSKNYLRVLDNYATVTAALNRSAEASTYTSKAQTLRGELGTAAANSETTGAPAPGSTAKGKSSHAHAGGKHSASKAKKAK